MSEIHYTAKQKRKHAANRLRHNFLLEHFFQNTPDYSEKDLGNWILIKHRVGNTGDYEVAIYTRDSYTNYKEYTNQRGLFT